MATQDVFNPDSFQLTTLTAALLDVPHLPSMLGDAGLFEYEGINTLTVEVEKEGSTLALVQTTARGAKGNSIARNSRNMRNFRVAHLQIDDAIRADEVQGVRLFGSENESTPLDVAINKIMRNSMRSIDLTMENHRLGAIKGQVLDADGAVLVDLFTEFGVAQNTIDFVLDSGTTDVRLKCDDAINAIEDELGGLPYTGMTAWCGRTFWQSLIGHTSVKETYLGQAEAAQLRGNPTDTLDFGGIRWVKYRGAIGGTQMIGANDAYIVPQGVPGLLIGRFGPGDWIDTVNTIGLPAYARGYVDEKGKGVDIEVQSNPLHLCTRPRAVLKATV
ncbi:MAG: hypothetical protein RL456_2288 [Pseudomonadota bacterium]|jgi:hypothetical protein